MKIDEAIKQGLAIVELLLLIATRAITLAKGLKLLRETPPVHSYENLFLDLTLDLQDAAGKRAVVTHKQRVRFLVEEAGVVTSPIWGEGNQIKRYELTGASRLGSRPEGSRQVQLLGLEQPPVKNSQAVIHGRRTIADGFIKPREYFETMVERPTKRLSLQVLFPKGRPPSEAYVAATPGESPERLPVRLRRDGRAKITWMLRTPLQRTIYSLRWAW